MGEVGTHKIHEDERVIIWEFLLDPGERTSCHTHRYDYVFYVLEGTTLEVFDEADRYLGAFEAPAGAVFSLGVIGEELVSADDKGLRAPATHSTRNAGPTRYREMLVELKPWGPDTDPRAAIATMQGAADAG